MPLESMERTLAVADEDPSRFIDSQQYTDISSLCCKERTVLLKVVATKAATTTMETTILTVVETVEVMLNVLYVSC
jgi:hypothetical protein